jgi:hypothetical protein
MVDKVSSILLLHRIRWFVVRVVFRQSSVVCRSLWFVIHCS